MTSGPDLLELLGVALLLLGVFLMWVPAGLVLTGVTLVVLANTYSRDRDSGGEPAASTARARR